MSAVTDPADKPLVQGVRARARQELTRQILDAGRRQLVEHGAAQLSLRAVARDLGVVSSAVYRYVSSRDELLTLLIVEAYDALGEAVETAEAAVARQDLAGRWMAVCRATREWALGHPHEYGLIFGSPVPGYQAPQLTVGPATRVPAVLTRLLADEFAGGAAVPRGSRPGGDPATPDVLHHALEPVRRLIPASVPDDLVVAGLMAWTYLFGAVSFELFGHRHQVVADDRTLRDAFFVEEMTRLAVGLGLLPQ